MRLVLASASPRRRELLGRLNVPFTVVPASVEEAWDPGLAPEVQVEQLALAKARAVAGRLPPADRAQTAVLGADTAVVLGSTAFGKPASPAEAASMLRALSGRTHRVLTGLALLAADGSRQQVAHQVTEVSFRRLCQAEIEAYVATGEPLDKAGAYALQGIGLSLVASVRGCVSNVIGLPLPMLVAILADWGIDALPGSDGSLYNREGSEATAWRP